MYLFEASTFDPSTSDVKLLQEIYDEIESSPWQLTEENVIWCYRWIKTECGVSCEWRWRILKYLLHSQYPYLLAFPLNTVVQEIRDTNQLNKVNYILSPTRPGKFIRMRVHADSVEVDHLTVWEFIEIKGFNRYAAAA